MSVHDYAAQREAGAGPGADTRQWISNGTVNADQPGAPAVDFTPKAGPLVSVRLHPSDIDVRCRCASYVASLGEGEWHPFAGGDEVIVALPMGHERGGATIIGRLNNGIDTFPTNIANNDVTANNISTKKSVPNYAWEISNGWILRSITTGAQLALDRLGGWMLNSGDLHFVKLDSQGASLAIAGLQSIVNINATTGQITLAAGSVLVPGVPASGTTPAVPATVAQNKTTVVLDPSTGNIYATTQGGFPVGHVASIEGLVGLVASALTLQGVNTTSSISSVALVAALLTYAAAVAVVEPATVPAAGALAAALGSAYLLTVPIPPPLTILAVNGAIAAAGTLPPFSTFAGAVQAKLAIPRDPTGLATPGLGSPGFFV